MSGDGSGYFFAFFETCSKIENWPGDCKKIVKKYKNIEKDLIFHSNL